ncbi:restriction endonuclease subunit S [Geobacillus stearothermophilus]|uniref:restriction endonuclease subunit S n=1 Tax=Geobacillus stearothermophilus TaxID=1422 RepID=UPI003D1F3077
MKKYQYRLGDLIERVIDNRGKTPPYQNEGIPIIEVASIAKNNRHPDYKKVNKYVNTETYKSWFRSGHPQNGDVLVSTVGQIGKVSIMDETVACIAQNIVALRVKKELLVPDFLYYYLIRDSVQDFLQAMNIGSAQPSIKVPHLLDLTVDIPTIETQKKIVGILKSLDDKIELNLKMNETLEEMAMTLYKHWFVENEDLERVSIEEFGSIIGGGTPKTTVAEYWDGNIPWISVKDLNSAVIIETEKKITEAGLNNSSTKLLPPFSTVLSARGTIGNISIIGKEMTMNQSCYAIKAKDELDCFVFLTLKSSINTLISQSHGSVFNTITKDTLKSLELPFNKDFAIKFEKKVKPMFLQILSNTLENKELQDIRDYLLPRLLSGEIDLSKAEKQVEKVL